MSPSPPVQLQVQATGTGAGTISSSPSGISCGQACSATFEYGTQVTLTAEPSGNSVFVGWQGACSGTNPCTVTLTQNMSVTALFKAATGPILPSPILTVSLAGTGTGTISSSPAGISCSKTCSGDFAAATKVTLTATPASTSTFTGWSGACTGTGACEVTLSKDTAVTATFTLLPSLTVTLNGTGSGTVTSSPAGINCGTTCTAHFMPGTQVTLTATVATGSAFFGWGGNCSGSNTTCTLSVSTNSAVTATFNISQGLNSINHIIFMAQENRSLDSYFGAMRQYWAQNGIPDQSFDGLPQFNPTSGIAPLYGPPPAIPGCNPNDPYSPPPAPFQDCVFDTNSPVTSYHLITQCIENPSPFWNESHVDWDYNDQNDVDPFVGNGFVWTAAHDARENGYNNNNPYHDTNGLRVMGYYDGTDLNYYYFMASKFATSDRWFNPTMSRTEPNRQYLIAATSQGYVYPIGSNNNDKKPLTATTIFQELQDAGITWKIYVNPAKVCPGPPYQASCLVTLSYVYDFQWSSTIPTQYPNNIGTIGPPGTCGSSPCDFENDLANGTLPQVAQIEPASDAGFDEHPSDYDASPINIQSGANYVSGIINSVMSSQYWKDTAFILTYDEFGGTYDHVSPQPEVSPDGIAPVDLETTDICYGTPNVGTCNFTYTGYRIPLIVISPYAKQNYVDHTVADTTAILKLIETRFSVPALTARDAAQIDMTEFFDFTNPPWMTPPSPPAQNTSGPCYLNKLP
jgi:phospholipase C